MKPSVDNLQRKTDIGFVAETFIQNLFGVANAVLKAKYHTVDICFKMQYNRVRTGDFPVLSRVAVGVGYVFICFTPMMMAGHYRLFSRDGRSIYWNAGRDVPWLTLQGGFLAAVAILSAVFAGWVIAYS